MVDMWEWHGEDLNPGGRGAVTIRWGLPERRPLGPTLTYGLLGVIALGCGLFLAMSKQDLLDPRVVWLAVGVYLLLAYMIRPEADRHNLGWGGGLMDNPFRWSDDVNRWLMFLMIALWPGRFIAEGLIGLAAYPFRSSAAEEPAESEPLGPELMGK